MGSVGSVGSGIREWTHLLLGLDQHMGVLSHPGTLSSWIASVLKAIKHTVDDEASPKVHPIDITISNGHFYSKSSTGMSCRISGPSFTPTVCNQEREGLFSAYTQVGGETRYLPSLDEHLSEAGKCCLQHRLPLENDRTSTYPPMKIDVGSGSLLVLGPNRPFFSPASRIAFSLKCMTLRM